MDNLKTIAINAIPREGRYNLSSLSNRGFTLAEVLITLGIIGIVAAMTLPSLINKYQYKTYVTQLSQTCNLIQQAFLKQRQEAGTDDLIDAGLDSVPALNTFMTSKFKIVNSCLDFSTQMKPCFADTYRNINKTVLVNTNFWNAQMLCYSLSNGSAICIEKADFHLYSINGVDKPYGHILIDVNGAKGPNTAGRDLFFIAYYPDGSIDEEGVTPECRQDVSNCTGNKSPEVSRDNALACISGNSAKNCFGKILNDGWQMTY